MNKKEKIVEAVNSGDLEIIVFNARTKNVDSALSACFNGDAIQLNIEAESQTGDDEKPDDEKFRELVEKLHRHILKSTDPQTVALLAIKKLSEWILSER